MDENEHLQHDGLSEGGIAKLKRKQVVICQELDGLAVNIVGFFGRVMVEILLDFLQHMLYFLQASQHISPSCDLSRLHQPFLQLPEL